MIFAISLRSGTERHGDFSESVVFHFSFEVSWLFLGCLFFWLVFCLFWLVACVVGWVTP